VKLSVLIPCYNKQSAIETVGEAVRSASIEVQDVDLEYDPRAYSILLSLILGDRADVIFCLCFLSSRPYRLVYFWHMVDNKMLTLLSNMFTDLNVTDMKTCYKVFRCETPPGILRRKYFWHRAQSLDALHFFSL
jgi:hypothetical protein